MAESTFTAFKRAQVRYRRQSDSPDRVDDIHELVDFSRVDESDQIVRIDDGALLQEHGCYQGPIFTLRNYEGFYYVPQCLDESLQHQLAHAAVSSYCEAPHKTNIDGVPPKANEEENRGESMWKLWTESVTIRRPNATTKSKRRKYRCFQKLSWATMGYHYDWSIRTYHENAKSDMPALVNEIAILFATMALKLDGAQSTDFTPSACIVNYYNTKSLMGGHRDDLEFALNKPIVSLSFGRPAIFLLGGATKDDTPIVPILVRPGDVMMMGGKSRLRYHGMARLLPKILPGDVERSKECNQHKVSNAKLGVDLDELSEHDHIMVQRYLMEHRININVRQVYDDAT